MKPLKFESIQKGLKFSKGQKLGQNAYLSSKGFNCYDMTVTISTANLDHKRLNIHQSYFHQGVLSAIHEHSTRINLQKKSGFVFKIKCNMH